MAAGGNTAPRPDQVPTGQAAPFQVAAPAQGVVVAKLVIIVAGGVNTGLFAYNGTPGAGNPPVFWVVAPGVTTDPYGNTVAPVLGAGNPSGANTQIDAMGDVTLTGAGGSELALMPAANLPLAITTAFTGIMETLISLGSGDGNQVQSGVVSGVTVGTGSAAKMGTLVTSPYGSTSGMGLLLLAENDGGTDAPSMLAGTVTTQGGSITFTPSFAVVPGALIGYTGSSTINVVTKTTGSGTIPIPASASATAYGEAWGSGGNGGGTGGFATNGGGGGGSGGYSAESALAITPGGSVAYSVGVTGSDTTLTGSAVTVTAHSGGNGGDGSNGNGGTAAAASSNTIARAGLVGGQGFDGTGGGGGGAGAPGPGGAGSVGHVGLPHSGGAGGPGASGAGNGGTGGGPNNAGSPGGTPGAGGGGGGNPGSGGGHSGGSNGTGQVRLTYTTGAPVILWTVAFAAGTDPFGTSYLAGERITEADGNTYRTERLTQWLTSPLTVNFGSFGNVITAPVAAGTYRFEALIDATSGGANTPTFAQFTGPSASLVLYRGLEYAAAGAATDAPTFVSRQVALGAGITGATIALSTNFLWEFKGLVTFTASGTFALQVKTDGTHNWTVNDGTFLDLMPS